MDFCSNENRAILDSFGIWLQSNLSHQDWFFKRHLNVCTIAKQCLERTISHYPGSWVGQVLWLRMKIGVNYVFAGAGGFSHLTNSMFSPQTRCHIADREDAKILVLAVLVGGTLTSLGSRWSTPGGRWTAWTENSQDRCPYHSLKWPGRGWFVEFVPLQELLTLCSAIRGPQLAGRPLFQSNSHNARNSSNKQTMQQ